MSKSAYKKNVKIVINEKAVNYDSILNREIKTLENIDKIVNESEKYKKLAVISDNFDSSIKIHSIIENLKKISQNIQENFILLNIEVQKFQIKKK